MPHKYTKQGRWILLRFRIIEHRFSHKWFKIMYTLHRMNFHQSYSSFKGMFPKVVCKDFWWFLIRKLRVLKSLLFWFLHIESEFLWVVLPWLLTEWGRKLYFRIAWLYWTRDILFWIKRKLEFHTFGHRISFSCNKKSETQQSSETLQVSSGWCEMQM